VRLRRTTASGELVCPGDLLISVEGERFSCRGAARCSSIYAVLVMRPTSHAARPDLQGGGEEGRSSMGGSAASRGAYRNRATTCRRASYLPVPRVWRARPGAQARACRDVVIAPYASALALMWLRGGVPELAATCAEAGGRMASMRPSISPRRVSPRAIERYSPIVIGHHQGMSSSHWPLYSWTVRCTTIRSRTQHFRQPPCCSRSGCQRPPRSIRPPPSSRLRTTPRVRRRGCAFQQPGHAGS